MLRPSHSIAPRLPSSNHGNIPSPQFSIISPQQSAMQSGCFPTSHDEWCDRHRRTRIHVSFEKKQRGISRTLCVQHAVHKNRQPFFCTSQPATAARFHPFKCLLSIMRGREKYFCVRRRVPENSRNTITRSYFVCEAEVISTIISLLYRHRFIVIDRVSVRKVYAVNSFHA